MPSRIVREGILTSARMATLDWASECFFRRLMSVVDDFGRYYADAGLLRAACYPRQLNKVSDSDIGKWMRCVAEAALVRVYPAEDGERYLEIVNFGQQVRAKKSKFPGPHGACVADAKHPISDVHLDVSVSGVVSEDVVVSGEGAQARLRPTRRCPETFVVTPELTAEMEAECPGVDIEAETRAFRDHEFKDARSNWPGTWRNWIRRAWKAHPARGKYAHPVNDSPYEGKYGQVMAELTGGLMGRKTNAPALQTQSEQPYRLAFDDVQTDSD